MKKIVGWIILATTAFALSACSTFSYPNGLSNFTVLASGPSTKISQRNAMEMAKNKCKDYRAIPKILEVREVKNGYNKMPYNERTGGYTVENEKISDYFVAINFNCVRPKPAPKTIQKGKTK